jgi:hypothetical protein
VGSLHLQSRSSKWGYSLTIILYKSTTLSEDVIVLVLSRESRVVYITCDLLLVDFTIDSYMLSGIYILYYTILHTVPTTNRLRYGFYY